MKLAEVSALEKVAQQLKEKVPTRVSQLANDAGYQTAAEVAAQVAAAGHLTRRKVESVDAIDLTAEDADRYIYLVPSANAEDGNKYGEYMILDGELEKVGDTAVNLDGYQQKEEGKVLSSNDFTDEYKDRLDGIEVASDEEIGEMLERVFGS